MLKQWFYQNRSLSAFLFDLCPTLFAQVSARQERIINMIDALLGEEEEVEEGGEDMLHCSLDSIDRLGESLSSFPMQHKKES